MIKNVRGWLARLIQVGALTVAAVSATSASAATGTLVRANCSPIAAAADGTMVWHSATAAGWDDVYVGDGNCSGTALLPPHDGHRGPADITKDGRYVLLVTAVGWDRRTEGAAPGKGSQNAIQLYDRQAGKLSTLLPGALKTQRGVIWPKFNADGTKIVWAQMTKTMFEVNFPWGDWELHVADVNLATGTLSNNRAWHDPSGNNGQLESYGWIPRTNRIVFLSNQQPVDTTKDMFRSSQLYSLPDTFSYTTPPTRISPKMAPSWSWQKPVDVFHEFAHFSPNDADTMYTSIGANTVGGDDLFTYDLRTAGSDGLLGQPKRISYFGGDMNLNWGTKAIPGWPAPRYRVVINMAWINGAWVAGVCPDMYCTTTEAWRISLP